MTACDTCGHDPCQCTYPNPVAFPVDPPTVEGTEVTTDVDER